MFDVKIIADTIGLSNIRLTTFELKYPRFIHSQIMTHRVFSRNAASSRAIPTKRLIEAIEKDDVRPVVWGTNNRGMVAKGELTDIADVLKAENYWVNARRGAINHARELEALGVHKQIVNRILEPFMTIKVIITATDYQNFFNLRVADDAQPEIQTVAKLMLEQYERNKPASEEWHIPYLLEEERESLSLGDLLEISVARCARVSYQTHNSTDYSRPEQDKKLYHFLKSSGHLSPFEHQAMSIGSPIKIANFRGWIQYRQMVDAQSAQVQH